MIDKIRETIKKYNMIPEGSTVVCAVSGGSDSMVLLNALNTLKNEYGLSLIAAHVNHGLRGESADRDEKFVKNYCDENGIEIRILRTNVAFLAKESGTGLEECGRKVRYDFFNSLGDDVVIATAHNLSDRVETFLFNFTRGSALRGLCSVPPVRDNIIRPLIDCSKEEILDFCKSNSIEYVTDETNSDVKYSRNRIRHNVVSELKKINPAFEACAERCMDSVNEDEKFLSSLAYDLLKKAELVNGFDAVILSDAPAPIKKRAVILICEKTASVTPEQKFIGRICDILENGGKIQINGGVTVRVRKGILDFPSEGVEKSKTEINGSTVVFGNKSISIRKADINETNNLQNVSKQDLEYYLDYDKIVGKVCVRSREAGDKITLNSRNCTKTLKKLFNEMEILPENRNNIAVFSDDCGVILVEGAGIDKRVAVNDSTRKILLIKIMGCERKSGND